MGSLTQEEVRRPLDEVPSLETDHAGLLLSFNQAVAATGRLSSSDPNLQNIPIRRGMGREIRKGFVPEAGYVFVAADYSQIELRVMAHLSGDQAFVEAFRADRDIHRETAALIFGVEADIVTPGRREQAKTINFATIYGQGPFALARQLGISRDEARAFIDGYFERFAGVADYLEEMKEMARRWDTRPPGERGVLQELTGFFRKGSGPLRLQQERRASDPFPGTGSVPGHGLRSRARARAARRIPSIPAARSRARP